jgi:SAM-dependent methyltransferase
VRPEHFNPGERALEFFESLWSRGDYWDLDSSDFERRKYQSQLELIADREYGRTLELGCGNGRFTNMLSAISANTVGVDISPSALAQARQYNAERAGVEFREANIMDLDIAAAGPWDLVVLSETICYLGWLYPFFDVAWLGVKLHTGIGPGGRLLMANTCGGVDDYLLQPWVIRSYHDLFRNVGFRIEAEQIFRGNKNGADIEVQVTLFARD